MPKKYSEEERRSFCAKWKSSGQSKMSFCKENGISESALHKWLTMLKQVLPPMPRDERQINFLPVDFASKVASVGITSKTAKNNGIEILLPNGILLKTEVMSIALLVKELVA